MSDPYPSYEPPRHPPVEVGEANPWAEAPRVKTSAVGWSSLVATVLTLIVGGIPLACLIVAGIMSEVNQTELAEDDPMVILGGCGVLIGLLIGLIGAILSIVACALPGAKPVPIVSLCVTGGLMVFTVFLIVLGNLAG